MSRLLRTLLPAVGDDIGHRARRGLRIGPGIGIEDVLQRRRRHLVSGVGQVRWADVRDQHGNPAILVDEPWRLRLLEERNPDIKFAATSEGPGLKR